MLDLTFDVVLDTKRPVIPSQDLISAIGLSRRPQMLLLGRLTSQVEQTRGLPLSSSPARHALLEVGGAAQAGGNDVAMTECKTKTRRRRCISEQVFCAKAIRKVHSFDDAS